MSIATLTRTARITRSARGGSARRVASLARGEALLLRRNPIALLNALALPAALVLFVSKSLPDSAGGVGVVTSLTAFTLLFVVYYNLVTAWRPQTAAARDVPRIVRCGCGNKRSPRRASRRGRAKSWQRGHHGLGMRGRGIRP